MQLHPYISFNGCCEEALNFYCYVFNGQQPVINRYAESPMDVPDDYKQKVMHGTMQFGENKLMAWDTSPGTEPQSTGRINLFIDIFEVFILDETFNRLAEGGTITMPLQDTFWGARFGTIRDKFGVNWMFNCDLN